MRASRIAPFLVLGGATLLGGWFLQEGVAREENVYTQVRLFQEVVDYVSEQFVDEVEMGDVYRSAIDGLLEGLGDPNTSFIPARAYEDVRIRTQGDYGGVGLEVLPRDGRVTVMNPIPGTPGARAGIRPGDWFVEIDGESAEGLDVEAAVELLRGEPGTSVEVRMGRPGVPESIPFTLERAVILIRAVPFAERLDGDIGYIPLQVFQSTARDELQQAIDSLRTEGLRGLILDLRGNPGGLLEEGIGVTELFIDDDATVVETRGRGPGQSARYAASGGPAYAALPVVVLVDGSSASASEIVAGALQDHDRGVLVGTTTYGKGSVQTLFPVSLGNVLRLTTARWYTPVGRSIAQDADDETHGMDHAVLALSGAAVAIPAEADRPEFRSMAGRTLFGGGGIVPDVRVLPDTLTTVETGAVRALYREGSAFNTVLFNHVVAIVQDRPDLRVDFSVGAEELAAFDRALQEAGIALGAGVFADASRYIRYQLEREIALQAFGEAGQFRRMMRYDNQLQRALEVMEGATTTRGLLQAARRVEGATAASAAAAGDSVPGNR
jgi:carboxyl-terminal processing protease